MKEQHLPGLDTKQRTGPVECLGMTFESDEALERAVPKLIVEHNLHGVDIDRRAAQIASLALWMRAQRAFKDSDIEPARRPGITRTQVVVAEPMPGNEELAERFAQTLDPPLLADLFRRMVDEMRLGGELGSLLKIDEALSGAIAEAREAFAAYEKELATGYLPGLEPSTRQQDLDLTGVDEDAFFDTAEQRILGALRRFAHKQTGAQGLGRRLFANDAAQGVALLELLRERFDVVLMNPPFGAGSLAAKRELEKGYPRTKNDLYAAFVERGIQLLASGGMLGALTSRTGFFLSSFQRWREEILLKQAPPVVFADLGYGVLDSAMVEVAAYCLRREGGAA